MHDHDEDSATGDTALERHILAGDLGAVMDCIDAADESERKAMRRAIERLISRRWQLLHASPDSPLTVDGRTDKTRANRLFRATELARFLCADDQPACDYWQHIGIQDIAAYKARYAPAPSAVPIAKQLRGEYDWAYARNIHRAIVAGLVERPETEEYIDALFFGDLRGESNLVLKHVDADPGIAPHLLKLFEREGSSDGSFSAREKYCHDTELFWSHAFLTLCERGVYTRPQLLDKTLGALACDWPQFKSGWFSRFHEQLAPTVDEMAREADRYLALCHSRIAPTAGMALQAVAALYQAGRVDALAVCEAATPLVSATAKGQVLAALELLGQVAKNDAALAHHASGIAAQALGHTAADVHKKAIAFLAKWGLDDAGRELARGYLSFVSAVNRPALAALVGDADAAPSAATLVAAEPPAAPRPVSPLDASRALPPLDQIHDVVERMAYVLENPADVDEWERVAGALVRLAPIANADRAAFLALQKRARKLEWPSKPLPFALARVMAAAVDGEGTAEDVMVVPGNAPAGAQHFIGPRVQGLIAQALAGHGLTPLSTPTHRGGFIDPRQLLQRIQAQRHAGVTPPLSEQVLALMRLVPAQMDTDAAHAALAEARSIEDAGPLLQALRYALGDGYVKVSKDAAARPLFLAAARIRCPHADDAPTLAAYGDLGPDGPLHARCDWHVVSQTSEGGYTFHHLYITHEPALQPQAHSLPHHTALALCAKHLPDMRWSKEYEAAPIRFAASLLPSGLEPLFAEAARTMANNVDWWEAQWQNRAYLDLLLEPTTPFTPMALLLLAVALAGKEPGQTALAVDALVLGVQDGRLDTTALGDTLARLWATPLVKGPRYTKSLAAAAQAHAAMPAAVFALLCAMVQEPMTTWRKDQAPLLELLLELHLAHGLALPDSTRTALAAMKLGGKGKAAQQQLLGT